MQLGFLPTCLIAALIPLLVGFIYYNPSVMGNAWMKEAGLKEEQLKNSNMAVIFGLVFVFSFMLAMTMISLTIHQVSIGSIFQGNPDFGTEGTELNTWYKGFMAKYGMNFRTFKHGALHGVFSSIFLVLPLVSIISLFERRSWKYVFIHVGYWAITMALMGGFVCQFFKMG
ncbi:MAG: DUF1761 domain-containing protein [Bacteroidia bacterium]